MAAGAILEILSPGALTSVQDLGRYGHGRYGVAPSGALDTFAPAHRQSFSRQPGGSSLPGDHVAGPENQDPSRYRRCRHRRQSAAPPQQTAH